jgi:ankyrin repeat protein
MIAAASNKADMVSLLIKSGADVALKDDLGETAIEIAVKRESRDAEAMIDRLLKK